jgi:hypothetical protein
VRYKQHRLLHWVSLFMCAVRHIKQNTISYLFGATRSSQRAVYEWINLEHFDTSFEPVRVTVTSLYTQIFDNLHIYTYMCVYMYLCMRGWGVCVCMYVFMYACMYYLFIYVRTYVCMCVCMSVCMYVRM